MNGDREANRTDDVRACARANFRPPSRVFLILVNPLAIPARLTRSRSHYLGVTRARGRRAFLHDRKRGE